MNEPLMISFEAIRTQKEPNPEYLPIPKDDWVLMAEDDTNYIFKRKTRVRVTCQQNRNGNE